MVKYNPEQSSSAELVSNQQSAAAHNSVLHKQGTQAMCR